MKSSEVVQKVFISPGCVFVYILEIVCFSETLLSIQKLLLNEG